jgi:hypothetical protein
MSRNLRDPDDATDAAPPGPDDPGRAGKKIPAGHGPEGLAGQSAIGAFEEEGAGIAAKE